MIAAQVRLFVRLTICSTFCPFLGVAEAITRLP